MIHLYEGNLGEIEFAKDGIKWEQSAEWIIRNFECTDDGFHVKWEDSKKWVEKLDEFRWKNERKINFHHFKKETRKIKGKNLIFKKYIAWWKLMKIRVSLNFLRSRKIKEQGRDTSLQIQFSEKNEQDKDVASNWLCFGVSEYPNFVFWFHSPNLWMEDFSECFKKAAPH